MVLQICLKAHLLVLWLGLLFHQCLEGTDPAWPLPQFLTTLQPFVQSQPSESVTQWSVITGTSQHHCLTLTLHRWTVNSQLHQNYSIELEAAISRVVNMRMRAPTLPLSGLLFQPWRCGSAAAGHFFCESGKEQQEDVQSLFKLQNQRSSCALLLDVQKPSQEVWG